MKVRTSAFLVLLVFSVGLLFWGFRTALAVSVEECTNLGSGDAGKIDECISLLGNLSDALASANDTNKKELSGLNTQLGQLKASIASISSQLDKTAKSIEARQADLADTQTEFEQRAARQYKFYRTFDPLVLLLSATDAASAVREYTLQTQVANEDRKTMESLGDDLITLKADKDKMEKNKKNLAALQEKVNTRATFLAGEVKKTENFLADLSSKQQELVALKSGGFSTSIGETPPTLEPCSGPPGSSNFCDPGFRPAFAAFSFGAPHRTGMSQYGAYGRSKSGQSAADILNAYYQGAALVSGYGEPANITVLGVGTVSFEDNYLMGIYEMPESWGDSGGFEALKAQAIASRTYALYYTGNGARPICTSEACQVYYTNLHSGKWREAVNSTRGMVVLKGGSPAPTYYASTSGGFTLSQWGWSGIKDASGSWPDTAYEKVSGSPWFYKGWFRSRAGASCGRSSPWLTSDEMADILNAWVVVTKGGGDTSRVTPSDTSCWGGNPYSKSDLVGIGGYTAVTSAEAPIFGNDGATISVTFSTNKGSVTVNGGELMKAFNLRAPGYVGLKSSLFKIEKL